MTSKRQLKKRAAQARAEGTPHRTIREPDGTWYCACGVKLSETLENDHLVAVFFLDHLEDVHKHVWSRGRQNK